MDPSAVLRDSYPLTDRIEHFIARAPGNQALTNRLSCVTYLIYGVRSRLQASVRDCPEGSRSDRCEQLSLLLSQMVETSWVVLESGGLLESALQWEASFLGRVAGCFVKSRRSADTVIMLEGALEKRIKQFKELDEGGNMAKTDTGPYFVPPRMVFSYQPPGRFDAAWQVFCTHMRILLTGAAGVGKTVLMEDIMLTHWQELKAKEAERYAKGRAAF